MDSAPFTMLGDYITEKGRREREERKNINK